MGHALSKLIAELQLSEMSYQSHSIKEPAEQNDLSMPQYSLVGIADDINSIIIALNNRRRSLGLTMAETDHIAGLTTNYASKVLSPTGSKKFGQMSLPSILGAFGLKLAIIADDNALPAITRRAMREKTLGPSKIEPARRNRP